MVMLLLSPSILPHHKLDLDLREKRLDPLLPKVILRIERQAVLLVPVLLEQRLEVRGRGEGCGG